MNKEELDKHRRMLIELNKELQQENKQLKEKLKLYEEPDDMTLMFMWCDEKAKDKIKVLQERIDKAIELVKKGIDFKSIYFKRNENTEMWQILLIDDIKDRFLEILGDKENE